MRDEKGPVRKGAGKSSPSQQVEVWGEGRDKGPGVEQAGRPQELLGGRLERQVPAASQPAPVGSGRPV